MSPASVSGRVDAIVPFAPISRDDARESDLATTTTDVMDAETMETSDGRRSRSNAGARGRGVMMGRDGEEARDGARRTPRNASRRKRGRPRASAPEEGSLFWLVEAAEKAAPEGARGNETVKKRRGRPRKESSRSTVSVKAQSGSVMKRKKTNDGGERAREDAGGGAAAFAAVGGFKDEDAFDDDDRSEYDDEEGGEGDEDAGDDDSSERRRSRHRGGKGFTQQWTKEEDDELVALIEKYGAKRWSYIASHMRRRRGKQCRDRYLNHLRPGIRTGEWSAEEEQILIEGHKALGTKWAALAKLLVGRPENAIKNHWHATLRCKTHKTRGEAPKISALKRYQMSLAQSAENGAAEDGAAEPTRSHATATTTATNATTATTVDGAENLGGMSRSARNSRYSRAQREEIEQGLTRMRDSLPDKLKAVWQIADDTATEDDRGASADLKTNDKATAAAATTEKSGKSGDDVAFVTASTGPSGRPISRNVGAGGAKARSSITSAFAPDDFIRVDETPIDIVQCQTAVTITGAPEMTMLASTAAVDGPSSLRGDARLSDDVILKGLRDIAATMRSRYELSRLALVIRSGALKIGDTKTCIAVSGHDWKTVAAAADAASRLVKSEYSFHSP